MGFTAEEFSETQKTVLGAAISVATNVVDGAEKFLDLNVSVAKAAFNDGANHLQAAVTATSPQDLVKLQFEALQPVSEKSVSYLRKSSEIAQSTASEVTKLFGGQFQELQKQQTKVLDNLYKNAPAGSESLVNFFKSFISSTNNVFESTQKAVKQAVDVAQANLDAVTTTAANFTKQAATAAAPAAKAK